jgi:hypothetical protein
LAEKKPQAWKVQVQVRSDALNSNSNNEQRAQKVSDESDLEVESERVLWKNEQWNWTEWARSVVENSRSGCVGRRCEARADADGAPGG